jgi:hypothetical protein
MEMMRKTNSAPRMTGSTHARFENERAMIQRHAAAAPTAPSRRKWAAVKDADRMTQANLTAYFTLGPLIAEHFAS